MSKPSQLQIPGIRETIEYLSESDMLNRCRFFLNWKDGEMTRSQVFFADPNRYGHPRPGGLEK